MKLENMMANIRTELNDEPEIGSDYFYTEDELVRAIEKTISLMSRLLPKRTYVEATLKADMIVDTFTLDLSSILTDFIKIERIEYPSDGVSKTFPTFDIVDNYCIFRTDVNLTAGENIRIIYLTHWTPPTLSLDGDYPSHLEDPLIIGASGQALIFKAEYYTRLAGKALEETEAIVTSLSELTVSEPADLPSVPVKPSITLPPLPTSPNISISVPEMPWEGAPEAVPVPTTPEEISWDAFDAALSFIDEAETGDIALAKDYLDTGEPLINSATYGKDVGATYGQYGQIAQSFAVLHTNKAQLELQKIEQQIAISKQEQDKTSIELSIWSAETTAKLNYLEELIRLGSLDVDLYNGDIRKAEVQLSYLRMLTEMFSTETNAYIASVNKYQADLGVYSSKSTAYINLITQLSTKSDKYLALAGRYLASGQAKINEMLASFGIKPEFTTSKALGQRAD